MSFAAAERFRTHNFEEDERWLAYLNLLTFPPNTPEAKVLKFKAKWFKREVDAALDVDGVLAEAPSTAAPPKHQPRTAPQPQPRSTSHQQQQQQAPRAASPLPSSLTLKSAQEAALLVGHVLLVVACLGTLQPFDRYLSMISASLFQKISLLVHGYRLYAKVGAPSIAALSPWMQRTATTTEFFYLVSTMLLVKTPYASIGILSMAGMALLHASSALNTMVGGTEAWRRFKGADAYNWLQSRRPSMLFAMAQIEVVAGFMIIFAGLRGGGLRVFMNAFMYFNQLRVRFWSPESRNFHVKAWISVGEAVKPLLERVEALRKVALMGEKWFNAAGQRAA